MPPTIDSHAHVNSPRFDHDRDDVLARAWAAGVSRIVNVGADVGSSRASIALAESDERIFATVGIHPHEAARVTAEDLRIVEQLAAHPRVVAIGECGLDRGPHNAASLEEQLGLLREQVRMARRVDLPLVLHVRDAFEPLFALLDEEADGPYRGVMHCFSGGPDEALRSVGLGFHLSFSGVLTFKNAPALRAAARVTPHDRLLVETDCPYLAPEPHRGRRNEPAFVQHTVARLAAEIGLAADEVERRTESNTAALFRLPSKEVPA